MAHLSSRWKIAILAIVLSCSFFFIFTVIASLYNVGAENVSNKILHKISQKIVETKAASMQQDEHGFINILLIGKGGAGHSGGELMDSIMVVSIDVLHSNVMMLSVPRDLWISNKTTASRINAVYANNKSNLVFAYGMDDATATKAAMSAFTKEIEGITGLKIPYYANIDFQGFVEIVDEIGGVTVHLEKAIYDTTYPDFNWGYQLFAMKPGEHHLDGATALKYARSRHGSTDFERAARQQEVIQEMKEKIISLNILTSPEKMNRLLEVVKNNFTTNLTNTELFTLAFLGKSIPKERMISAVINGDWDKRGGFLLNPPQEEYGGASVLIPYLGERNFSDIKLFTQLYFLHRNFSFEKFEVRNANNVSHVEEAANRLERFGISVALRNETAIDFPLDHSELWIYKEGTDFSSALPLLEQIFPIKIVPKIGESLDPELTATFVLGKDFR